MSRPVARYSPSRRFLLLAALAACGSLFCAWAGVAWGLTWTVAAVLFAVTALATLALALYPTIEIHDAHLQIGRRMIFWREIRSVDRGYWNSPLLVRLTLAGDRKVTLFYPGDRASCATLLRRLCRHSREALLDGVPYNQFWGEPPVRREPVPPPRPLLRPEDEEEVERLFQRLKTVGRLDQRGSDEP